MKSVKFFVNSKGVVVEGETVKHSTRVKGKASKGPVHLFKVKDSDLTIRRYVEGEHEALVYEGSVRGWQTKDLAAIAKESFGIRKDFEAFPAALELAVRIANATILGLSAVKAPKAGKKLLVKKLNKKAPRATLISVAVHRSAEATAAKRDEAPLVLGDNMRVVDITPQPDASFLDREREADLVMRLRRMTGIGIDECRRILEEHGWEFEKALDSINNDEDDDDTAATAAKLVKSATDNIRVGLHFTENAITQEDWATSQKLLKGLMPKLAKLAENVNVLFSRNTPAEVVELFEEFDDACSGVEYLVDDINDSLSGLLETVKTVNDKADALLAKIN